MLLPIILILAAILAVVLIVAAFRSPDSRVERGATIAAPAATIFAEVNDLHRWQGWSPWEKLDPALKRDYSGTPAGVGAVYGWTGNGQVGTGRMTIVESRPAELIRIKLEFLKPFTAVCTAEFNFKPAGGSTAVTWSMAGTNDSYFCKLIGLFVDMDKMTGGQFEKGLADLKKLTEAAARK